MDGYTREELIQLEEEIKDNVEWLYTTEDDEVECIGIENLEGILNRFLELKQFKLKLRQ
jgi:hypothetical protein